MKSLILLCACIVTLGLLSCSHEVTKIEERVVTAPPIHIRDTVWIPQKVFVLNPSCDTGAILAKYCNPMVEHTDSAGNFWRAKYDWISGRFTEFVNTHPQQVKYIDTTLNVTYNKVDPGFWWMLWFGFKVALGTIGFLAIAAGVLYGLSKFSLIKLPFGL